MSQHYEVVFSLYLRDTTPPAVLEELGWHLGLLAQRPPDCYLAYDTPILAPDPASRLPGGDSAHLARVYRFTRNQVDHFAWSFYLRALWLDDQWGEVWWQVATLIAPHAVQDGYAGFFRELDDEHPTHFLLRQGKPYFAVHGEAPQPFEQDTPNAVDT